VIGGHMNDIKILLDLNCHIHQITSDGNSALHIACSRGNEEVVRFLCENKADIEMCDEWGKKPVNIAYSKGFTGIFQFLQEEEEKKFGVYNAVYAEDIPKINHLLSISANINGYPKEIISGRKTPLHIATINRNLQILKILLNDKTCNKDARDRDDCTALHLAAMNDHKEIVQLLVKKGCNINALDRDGWTPLDYAKHYEYNTIISILDNKNCN